MTNPFEAAIEVLQRDLRRRDRDLRYPDQSWSRPQIESAIRVLKAAGGVDKRLAFASLHETIFESDDPWREDDPIFQQIYALLAALPDKEKE